MTGTHEDSAYIDRLLKQLQLRLAPDEYDLAATFAQLFWARTLEEDLAVRDIGDDAGATIEAWRRLSDRRPEAVEVRLHNPVHARDGWQSSHTIVEVTAPNMPFMVDSVLMALSHDGLVTHHLNNVVFAVDRGEDGTIEGLAVDQAHANRELLIYAEIDRLEDSALTELRERLEAMASELQAVVDDFEPMKAVAQSIVAELSEEPPALPPEEVAEGRAFLDWMLDNHFVFLGYREFTYEDGMMRQTGPALGMQRVRRTASARRLDEQPEATRDFLMTPTLLTFSKSGTRSRVHRPAYPDYVGVKRFDADGRVVGEVGFLGLYTSRAYQEFPDRIPVVRRKVSGVLARSGLDPTGFDGKVLNQVLTTFPRDELFQSTEDELFETALVITDIHERRRVRVFPRYDAYGLFVTTLVYMPRDLFSTGVRVKLATLLQDTFDAEDADHDIFLSESILVRVQFNLRIRPGSHVRVDRVDLERRITEMIGDWVSDLNTAMVARFGESRGRRLHRAYADAFPAGYRERFSVRSATDDIAAMEELTTQAPLSTQFYRRPGDAAELLRLKIYHLGPSLPLSDLVPKFEHQGLRVTNEHTYTVRKLEGDALSVHDFDLTYATELDLNAIGADFNEAFVRVWHGQAEDDDYNGLILAAGFDWRQVSALRAYGQYMKQTRFGFSQAFIAETLHKYKHLTVLLLAFFDIRFNPAVAYDAAQEDSLRQRIEAALEEVSLLNEDRILRRYLELMSATVRTNYYVRDAEGAPRNFLSLKLMPGAVRDMPRPVPMFEIFVSAPSFEAVHLRAGTIARGGLRWSDRHEDFRTEVLGLVKAQAVKNAVIVPTGAKGGFVVKGNREGVECYRDFIRGMLDVTDNIVRGEVTGPPEVRRHDEPDPYLVVAADKGTATFSDVANGIAAEYDFWLGDAFASGGSNGYDHKKMGITARGAWVSVQRHFAEKGIDVQRESITVLGVGDMGGDVFGNGMLLSPCLKLVAAFNHLHIFIDPDPDPAKSFAERQRLFELPRSSWADYAPELISAGGGVFSRTAKAITITPEMRRVFGLDAERLAPDELIHLLLKSPVQLIWNGGIGTYVKASTESHGEVGDRANDHLRVNAADLRCVAFGEGGNLGLTQRARVEFSLAGGAVNSDFIDNSAGVDCSDHEANIKIALNELVAGEDMTNKQRNVMLEAMTDDVAALVLTNNYRQAHALSVAERHASMRGGEYQRCVGYYAQHAGLDRELEDLPGDEQLAERAAVGQGLARPELAVLLAYAKSHVKEALMQSDLHTEPLVAEHLFTVFPERLTAAHRERLQNHRLAQDIIATQVANELVDFVGLSLVPRQIEIVGGSVTDIVRVYVAASRCFDLPGWFESLRAMDTVAAELKLAVWLEVVRLGRRAMRWMLRHDAGAPAVELVEKYKPAVDMLIVSGEHRAGAGDTSWEDRVEALVEAGLPRPLAERSSRAADLAKLLPIVDVASQHGVAPGKLAELANVAGRELHIDWLVRQIIDLGVESHWQALERDALLDELDYRQSVLGALVLTDGGGDVATWLEGNPRFASVWQTAVDEARIAKAPDFSMYSIVTRKLADLCASLGC